MLKVFAFESAGAGIAGGFFVMQVADPLAVLAKAMCAVAACATASVVLVVLVRQVDEHARIRKHFWGV